MYAYPIDSVVTYAEDGTPQYDRAVDSSQLRELYSSLMTNGVLLKDSSNLQVSASTNMEIVVNPGLCHIQGCIKKFSEDTTITIASANATMSRIDTVVARLDLNSNYRDIGLFVIQGTPASVPTRPELTRNTSVYEIALADITVGANATTLSQANISDTRLDTNRCGIISAISQFDTTKLYEQIESDLLQFQESNEVEFEEWFGYIKDQLSEDAAGNLQNQIDDHIAEDGTTENGAHGFRYFEGKLQAHIYDEESMTLKWVTVPGSGIAYDEEKSVQGAIDELSRTIGYTVNSKNYLPNNIASGSQYGVTCTVNADKSITLNGKNTHSGRACWNLVGKAIEGVYEEIKGLEVGENYILNGCSSGSSDTYGIYAICQRADGSTYSINEYEGENSNTFTHEEGNKYRIYIGVTSGVTVSNLTFYPMIRYASIQDGTYEPYVEDVKTQIDNNSTDTKVLLYNNENFPASINKQNIAIPNYQNYNALFISIGADANNGNTYYIPKGLYTDILPFSVYSQHQSAGVNITTGYFVRAHGLIYNGNINIQWSAITGWTALQIKVWGLK